MHLISSKLSLFFFLFIGFTSFGQKVGIIGAMPEEIRILTEQMTEKEIFQHGGVTFFEGQLKGKEVVVLKAGIGKVNATYSTTMLLEKYNISKVIFTGVAGGLHPHSYPGDMVIGTEVFHHDYVQHLGDSYEVRPTINLSSNDDNPMFFECDSLLLSQAKVKAAEVEFVKVNDRSPKVFTGRIATGDVFLSNAEKAKWLYESFDALACEMEGAAVGQVCYQRKIPFLVIRSCSDNANNQAHLDFNIFMKPAAENAIRLVLAILESE